jgi:diguanylate cyclase (GGDEF)-like protein
MEEKITIEKWITDKPITIDRKASLANVVEMMSKRRIGAVLVTQNGKLTGIFSERDLLNLFSGTSSDRVDYLLAQPIDKYMTRDPICAQADEDYNVVYTKMKAHNIRHIPIMDEERIVGIVSMRDLVHFYQNKLETAFLDAQRQIESLNEMLELSSNERLNALVKEIDRYRQLSLTDPLTGLYNQRYFQSRLKEEVTRASRHGVELSLVFCDIDHFKRVNDEYGHHNGDEVLKQTADLLRGVVDELYVVSRLRKSDIVARYGGEEFVIILPETGLRGAVVAAEKIRKLIENHVYRVTEEQIHVTMSFGVAEITETAQDAAQLIKNADYAMYKAKQKGRNRVEVFSSEDE